MNVISAAETERRTVSAQVWYRPTFSPEHGVYVVLLVSFLTGAAAAQAWNLPTTLAIACAFLGLQAEHPLVLQIKQRKSPKPRFLVWAGLYGGTALAIAVYLFLQVPLLGWIYLGAIAALLVDGISVFYREQKSITNEIVTFAAVCLAAPLAYAATTGMLSTTAIGLWLLDTLFFCCTIFTVKLRKPKNNSITPVLVYHAIAVAIVVGLYGLGVLSPIAALAFGVAMLKLGLVLWQQEWYRNTAIGWVAMLETSTAIIFLGIVSLSLLPVHLTSPIP